jgi:hypothetical protein
MELSKADKKAAREIIEKGLQNEFANGLNKFQTILNNWKENKIDNREAYQTLYRSVKNYDKHIARRYDNMKGSTYLLIIAGQLIDEAITVDDLNALSEEAQQHVLKIAEITTM